MDSIVGLVSAVAGSQMTVTARGEGAAETDPAIGTLVKARGGAKDVIGTVVAIECGAAAQRHAFIVDLLGELTLGEGRSFARGVSHYPLLGTEVYAADSGERAAIFAPAADVNMRVGTLFGDESQPAYVGMDELLAKHFAIVGATGAGKSCTVALMISAMLAREPNAHIVLLDAHNEYTAAFGDIAEVLSVDNLRLPLWLLDLEEAVRVLARGGNAEDQEAQAAILKDVIMRARRHAAADGVLQTSITADTPVPYRVFDLVRFINEAAGRLDRADSSKAFLRLRARLESLRDDRRFGFMFADEAHRGDPLAPILGRLLRIPVAGKPLTIVDLSGVPSEIADVVVSLTARIIFDFALWADPDRRPPILLVCEEAHRYVPQDRNAGFAAAERALTRIAKEGRKYGLSLALVTQRPSELSATALSQCGTVFALRMSSDADQRFVAKALPDAGQTMLRSLPSLGTQQAIVFGEAVSLPVRIRFDDLPAQRRPLSESARFSTAWQNDDADEEFLDETIRRWRLQTRSPIPRPELVEGL